MASAYASHTEGKGRQFLIGGACPGKLVPAARDGDAATVASALRNRIVDPNMLDAVGLEKRGCQLFLDDSATLRCTAIYAAADKGHVEVVKVLLTDDRVDPDIPSTVPISWRLGDGVGYTALMVAGTNKHYSVVAGLLSDERVNPNFEDENGETALQGPLYGKRPRQGISQW